MCCVLFSEFGLSFGLWNMNKIFKNDNFRKNVQKTGARFLKPADGLVCNAHSFNLNNKNMMLLGLVLLCAVMFWLLYKSVEFFDRI